VPGLGDASHAGLHLDRVEVLTLADDLAVAVRRVRDPQSSSLPDDVLLVDGSSLHAARAPAARVELAYRLSRIGGRWRLEPGRPDRRFDLRSRTCDDAYVDCLLEWHGLLAAVPWSPLGGISNELLLESQRAWRTAQSRCDADWDECLDGAFGLRIAVCVATHALPERGSAWDLCDTPEDRARLERARALYETCLAPGDMLPDLPSRRALDAAEAGYLRTLLFASTTRRDARTRGYLRELARSLESADATGAAFRESRQDARRELEQRRARRAVRAATMPGTLLRNDAGVHVRIFAIRYGRRYAYSTAAPLPSVSRLSPEPHCHGFGERLLAAGYRPVSYDPRFDEHDTTLGWRWRALGHATHHLEERMRALDAIDRLERLVIPAEREQLRRLRADLEHVIAHNQASLDEILERRNANAEFAIP
jgi:hypothetical protein